MEINTGMPTAYMQKMAAYKQPERTVEPKASSVSEAASQPPQRDANPPKDDYEQRVGSRLSVKA